MAAIHNRHVDVTGKRVAVILSGGNIDVNILSRIIDKGLVKDGRLVKFHVVVPDYPGQLARILSVVAELRGNVLEVSHSRAFSEAKIGETAIDLVIETRGPDHVAEIEQALVAHGFSPERRTSSERPRARDFAGGVLPRHGNDHFVKSSSLRPKLIATRKISIPYF